MCRRGTSSELRYFFSTGRAVGGSSSGTCALAQAIFLRDVRSSRRRKRFERYRQARAMRALPALRCGATIRDGRAWAAGRDSANSEAAAMRCGARHFTSRRRNPISSCSSISAFSTCAWRRAAAARLCRADARSLSARNVARRRDEGARVSAVAVPVTAFAHQAISTERSGCRSCISDIR